MNDFKREVLASQAIQSINSPFHTGAAGVFKHAYFSYGLLGNVHMCICNVYDLQACRALGAKLPCMLANIHVDSPQEPMNLP